MAYPACRAALRARPAEGLTLIELIVTLAILTIVLAISLPAASSMADRGRIQRATQLIVTQLALARSEAVRNHRSTVLCPSADGATCSGGHGWNHGFILYRDENRNRHKDASEEILRRFDRQPDSVSITTTVGRPRLIYHPDGSARGYNATITLCDLRGRAEPRTVILSNSGRVRVSDRKANGDPPDCPAS